MTLLQVNSLTTGHNGVAVVHDVNLMVESGEVVALLGANGAGKTTLLHTIAGLLPTINGTVFFNDQPVTGLSTHQIVRQGLSLLPENRGIFYQLTVAENLRLYKRQGGAVKVEEVFEYFPALKPYIFYNQSDAKILFGHDDPKTGNEDWTYQSDQGSFFAKKIPFIYFGVEDHKDYHKETDEFQNINQKFYTAAVNAILGVIKNIDKNYTTKDVVADSMIMK